MRYPPRTSVATSGWWEGDAQFSLEGILITLQSDVPVGEFTVTIDNGATLIGSALCDGKDATSRVALPIQGPIRFPDTERGRLSLVSPAAWQGAAFLQVSLRFVFANDGWRICEWENVGTSEGDTRIDLVWSVSERIVTEVAPLSPPLMRCSGIRERARPKLHATA